MSTNVGVGIWRPLLWVASPVILVAIGVALWNYQPTPRTTVEKVIEKPVSVPCPAIKTGSATAKAGKGGIAIGHSGNGDTFDVPAAQQKNK